MSRTTRLLGGAALALGIASNTAHANLLVNPGFETGTTAGWSTSGDTSVQLCAVAVVGCAPDGGTYFAAMNALGFGDGNASFTQTVLLPGPGNYQFGAHVSFGTDNAAGNFSQGQISLTIQLPGGQSEVVGFDPNALNGQFTIPGDSGFSFTPWFLLEDVLNFAGGPANALININVQDFSQAGIVLLFDNAFIEAVPEPAALLLFGSALAALVGSRRRTKSVG
jgi:hypothetical protein